MREQNEKWERKSKGPLRLTFELAPQKTKLSSCAGLPFFFPSSIVLGIGIVFLFVQSDWGSFILSKTKRRVYT